MHKYRVDEKFYWTNISPSSVRTFHITDGIKFSQMQIFYAHGKESTGIKVSPMRAGGEIGENFLLVKISPSRLSAANNFTELCTYGYQKNIILWPLCLLEFKLGSLYAQHHK